MKLVSKCGEVVIDIPEDLDYENNDVKVMIKELQQGLDKMYENGYFLYPRDFIGGWGDFELGF